MDEIAKLRARAIDLFQVAIDAADPAKALARQLKNTPIRVPGEGTLYIIAVGKAACPMMKAALGVVEPGAAFRALAVTNPENICDIPGCTVMQAGHPVPDANGLKAGRVVVDMLMQAGADDRVIALISGGGSALLPAPVAGVSLNDKARVSQLLLDAGVDITGMNMVRQQLSVLKGGGMARLAAPAKVEAFILSDVIGDDLRVIASGPTVAPIGTKADARKLLKEFQIFDQMPQSVRDHLSAKEPDLDRQITATNHLICSNRHSLKAICRAADNAQIIDDHLTGDVADAAQSALDQAMQADGPVTLIWGGETTVKITGTGLGGRNQEFALRFACGAQALRPPWVFLSGGTDGRDGPTDAAGGLVDPQSMQRIIDAGHDPQAFLTNNDSYHALKLSNDLLITGGTGTNVADVQIFISQAE